MDFKTKGDFDAADKYNPTMKYADVGTMNKSGYKAMAASYTED